MCRSSLEPWHSFHIESTYSLYLLCVDKFKYTVIGPVGLCVGKKALNIHDFLF